MARSGEALRACGKPLFFRAADPHGWGLKPPAIRLGTAVRAAVRSLNLTQKEALVASSRTGLVWRLASDEGDYMGGFDAAPPPLAFLSVGMAASYLNEIHALARLRGIDPGPLRLIQDNFYSLDGSILRGGQTCTARDVVLDVRHAADVDANALHRLVLDAVAASPLNGLMRGHKDSLFTLTHNGVEIAPDAAHRLPSAALPDPGECFDGITVAPGTWDAIVTGPEGRSPPSEEAAAFAARQPAGVSELLIHLQVEAMRRPDGMTEITQSLRAPRGSIFRFLADDRGRAPDAETYICAGIGLCFMTQFGKFAKRVGKPLEDLRILQDAHFSLAGASDGTGKAGAAAPLETHCFLFSAQDDAFARSALDAAEQTCFLHAFCRTDLKARVRITRG